MPKQTRQLAAIMFTDIVGYTALMGEDEKNTLSLVRKNRTIHQKWLKKFRGKLLKEMGDGVMASFTAIADAVYCAGAILREVEEIPDLNLSIGVHLGDVLVEGNEIYGDGINIASRIQSIAGVNQVVVSYAIQQNLKNKNGIRAIDLGEQKLKNVSDPIKVYSIEFAEDFTFEAMASDSKHQSYLSPDEINGLAVLPFDNLTGDPNQEYMVAGIHDSLITALSQITSVDIISKTSTMRYKHSDKSIPEIAEELGVEAIVEASVIKSTENIRINVQLIQATPHEKHLWAQIFDRPLTNILSLFDDITHSVAREINRTLSDRKSPALSLPHQIDPEAYKAYLNGQFHAEKLSKEGFKSALHFYQRSIELDPTFAPAYAGIAFVYITQLQMRQVPVHEAIPKMYHYNQKALDLDKHYSESQYIKALMSFQAEWDWGKSEEAYKKAIQSNPNHVFARAFYSHLLLILRRFDEANHEIEKAIRIDPNNPLILSLYGVICLHTGDIKKGLGIATKSWQIHPQNILTLRLLEGLRFLNKEFDKSIELLYVIYLDIGISFQQVKNLYLSSGYKTAIEKLAQILESNSEGQSVYIAIFFNRAGRIDKALDWLEIGYKNHDPDIPYAFLPIELDNLKSEPRYIELARKANILI